MELIKRSKCAVTQGEDLEHLYTFRSFPVFMGCTEKPESSDVKVDMEWAISRGSGLIQLQSLLPLDVLYSEPHGAGCIGSLWNEHHKAFAQFLLRFNLSSVFEIGGSHGILSKECCQTSSVPWTILEPNPSPVAESKANFIRGFFDENFRFDGSFDAVVHSHLFEHIYEPDKFMIHLSYFIEDGKYLIFSIPNMQVMLERKYTNCVNFEHTVFLAEPYVEYLLAKHGFSLIQKEYFKEDHSIFYVAVRDSSVKAIDLPSQLYDKNKKMYQDYLSYHEDLIFKLNNKIHSAKQPVYLFGAHVFAQYLVNFGLDTGFIACLLDNDPNKQGKRLYGTSLYVNSPKILKSVASAVVILKAGVYNEEIKDDILRNINNNVKFWE